MVSPFSRTTRTRSTYLMRQTLLAPDILEMLMAVRQLRRMNLIWFQRNPLPVDGGAQRQIVKRFEEDA